MIDHSVSGVPKMASQESSGVSLQLSANSLFSRLTVRLSRAHILIPLSLFLILLPIILAFVDGQLDQFFTTNLWRALLIQPTIIVYILLISSFLQCAGERMVISLRPIVQLTNEEFSQLVSEKSRVDPRGELMAIVIGALAGWFLRRGMAITSEAPWLQAYQTIFTIVMYSAIAWAIYGSVVGSRLTGAILRQPLQVDILDIRPFEPVGHASLLVSLAFIIGTTIAMVFTTTRQFVLTVENFLIYFFFACVTILVFFLNMRDTHRILADTKKRELDFVQKRISQAYQVLKCKAQNGEDTQAITAQVNAWIACEERLNQARTWPYNTEIISKLLISTLIPIGLELLPVLYSILAQH
jgi:hypothetical protein